MWLGRHLQDLSYKHTLSIFRVDLKPELFRGVPTERNSEERIIFLSYVLYQNGTRLRSETGGVGRSGLGAQASGLCSIHLLHVTWPDLGINAPSGGVAEPQNPQNAVFQMRPVTVYKVIDPMLIQKGRTW